MSGFLIQPFDEIRETGVTELIGADEAVAQNQYSASVGVTLGTRISGELIHITLFSRGGDVLKPDGVLLVLDADPAAAAGDAALTAAERITVIGQILVETTDWQGDANGATASLVAELLAFHAVEALYFVWFHELATAFNSAAGDDETLEFNAWYRRDS